MNKLTFKDTFEIRGHVSIDIHDTNGNLSSHWEENNLIVDAGRINVAAGLGGFQVKPISKIVFGTMGVKTDNPLTPKTASDGFNVNRTALFSEEATSIDSKGIGSWYSIEFDPSSVSGTVVTNTDGTTTVSGGQATIISETFNRAPGITHPVNTGITVSVAQAGKHLVYQIVAPIGAMYDIGNTYQLLPISESGLYCDDLLFAMKCFPTRLKTQDSKFTLTWTIYF